MLRASLTFSAFAGLLVACSAPEDGAGMRGAPDAPAEAPAATRTVWSFDAHAPGLRARSCPDTVSFARATRFELSATAIKFAPQPIADERLSGLSYAGGWHLTSDWEGFGGLSGLAVMRAGNLLAVSDQGNFVWIAMEDGKPAGSGQHAAMRDENGNEVSGKSRQDAEGLALRDGLALVSFERDHRILAFDLEGCGANARGAVLTGVPSQPEGMARMMEPNGGLEGLALSREGHLVAASETPDNGVPTGAAFVDASGAGRLRLSHRLAAQGPLRATGLDFIGDDRLTVHRHYDRQSGNTINLTRTPIGEGFSVGESDLLARLDARTVVDNFEAVAAAPLAGGATRIFLLSDDNFNNSQRTLLLAFDLAR